MLTPATSTREPPRTAIPVRGALEAAVVVVFALLIWSNYTLRRQHARSVAAVKSARAFAVHDSIDALPVVDLTGARGTLPFNGRTIVAIVDPRCDSCRELLGGIRPDGGTQVLSVAPLTETIAMAKATRLTAVTHALAEPPGGRIDPRTQIYPQLFVVEHGRVVRTCASVSECGTTTGPAPG